MLEHKHLIIRAEIANPPGPHEEEYMVQWFMNLIDSIGMKILKGPYVTYLDKEGNRGFTGVCIIETSHVAMHVWDEGSPGLMQLDVYTCGALDINIVFDKLRTFEPVKIDYKFLDREHGFKHLDRGRVRM
jgi:S-adenosylmethionine/arginine decarboxylase-like enzyme